MRDDTDENIGKQLTTDVKETVAGAIAALGAGIGVPCLASFWAELMVFIASFRVYPWLGGLAVCAMAVSALFMLRVVQRVCYGPANPHLVDLPDVSPFLGIPRVLLVAVIVVFGIFPSLMFDMIQTASIPLIGGLP